MNSYRWQLENTAWRLPSQARCSGAAACSRLVLAPKFISSGLIGPSAGIFTALINQAHLVDEADREHTGAICTTTLDAGGVRTSSSESNFPALVTAAEDIARAHADDKRSGGGSFAVGS